MSMKAIRVGYIGFYCKLVAKSGYAHSQPGKKKLYKLARNQQAQQSLLCRVEIYNHVLKMLARYGKLNFVRDLFKEMDLYSVTPNTDSWQALIAAHGKAGSSEGAVWAFEEMQRRRVPANNRSYNSLLSAFAHGGQWKLALEFLDK